MVTKTLKRIPLRSFMELPNHQEEIQLNEPKKKGGGKSTDTQLDPNKQANAKRYIVKSNHLIHDMKEQLILTQRNKT